MNYKNLIIKEKTTYQDSEYPEVFLKINDLSIPSFNDGKAEIIYSIYKSEQTANTHPEWSIQVNEIQRVQLTFAEGDMVTPDTVAGGVKQYLLATHPDWEADNLIIK